MRYEDAAARAATAAIAPFIQRTPVFFRRNGKFSE
jgi:hypothetical protein